MSVNKSSRAQWEVVSPLVYEDSPSKEQNPPYRHNSIVSVFLFQVYKTTFMLLWNPRIVYSISVKVSTEKCWTIFKAFYSLFWNKRLKFSISQFPKHYRHYRLHKEPISTVHIISVRSLRCIVTAKLQTNQGSDVLSWTHGVHTGPVLMGIFFYSLLVHVRHRELKKAQCEISQILL